MSNYDHQAWLDSHPKCHRCNGPIIRENYKGMNFWARLFQKEVVIKSKFQFFMERIDITKDHPSDQSQFINTEFELCNSCASDVFDYAQGKEPHNA